MVILMLLMLIAMCIAIICAFFAMIRILLFRETLFVYFKVVVVITVLAMICKMSGILYNSSALARCFLAGTLAGMTLFVVQLNRITIRSFRLNYINSLMFTLGALEVFSVSEEQISPVYTVLPVRNIIIFLLSVEVFVLAAVMVRKIRSLKGSFGGLVRWEEKMSIALVFESLLFVVASVIYVLSLFFGISENILMFNAIIIPTLTILLLHIVFVVSTVPFFVAFSGIEGIAVVIGGVKITSIGKIPDSLVLSLEKLDANSLKVVSKDKVLIYWRTNIRSKDTIRRLSIMMIGARIERNVEKFFSILSSCIRDRISRDYVLAGKLADVDFLLRQIESPIPPSFLKEEFRYAIKKFREVI